MASAAFRSLAHAANLRAAAAAVAAGAASSLALTQVVPHVTPLLTSLTFKSFVTTANCSCRTGTCGIPLSQPEPFCESGDLLTKLEFHYKYGHLTEIYEMLNKDPQTSSDPKLLFHLARATYKLGIASPLEGRKKALNDEALLYIGKALQMPLNEPQLKADVHALYAIVLQNRGAKKQGAEKKKFYEAAQEHLVASLKEDRRNFLANYAFAEMNRDLAMTTPTTVVQTAGYAFGLFGGKTEEVKEDNSATWKAVNRYAAKAVNTDPTDVQALNLLAQAKYHLGELAEAKKVTVRCHNQGKAAKFADERKAAREARELMEKINAELAQNN